MLITLCLTILLVPSLASADETPPADSARAVVWSSSAVTRLAGSHAGYRNWAKGGLNTLAFTVKLDHRTTRTSPTWEVKQETRLAYGLLKQDSLDTRKADDLIHLHTALRYRGDGFFRHLRPTLSAQLRTQFHAGLNYKKNPFKDGRPAPVKVSDFFAPATLTQSLGLSYALEERFSTRLGVGSKQTVVAVERFRPLYGVEAGRAVQWDVGVESRTQLDHEIVENVRIKSALAFFAAFNRPDLPDLTWETDVMLKVNRWIGVNVEFDALYDRDISADVQTRQVVSLGLSVDLI